MCFTLNPGTSRLLLNGNVQVVKTPFFGLSDQIQHEHDSRSSTNNSFFLKYISIECRYALGRYIAEATALHFLKMPRFNNSNDTMVSDRGVRVRDRPRHSKSIVLLPSRTMQSRNRNSLKDLY